MGTSKARRARRVALQRDPAAEQRARFQEQLGQAQRESAQRRSAKLADEEMKQLSARCGGPDNISMADESEFCQETGCPPEELENWLQEYFTERDIDAVIAGEQEAGKECVLLVRLNDGPFRMRLFSPSEKLRRDSRGILELRRLYEL